jgi:hypothetical protein
MSARVPAMRRYLELVGPLRRIPANCGSSNSLVHLINIRSFATRRIASLVASSGRVYLKTLQEEGYTDQSGLTR